MRSPCRTFLSLAITMALATVGCRSPRVDVTVENRTGEAVRLLEVSYPSASFGADSLAVGATVHNSVQLRGEGPIKVTFTNQKGPSAPITGPTLVEKQHGSLQIVLLAGGKATFLPSLAPLP